jgi:DNA-binding PadR family transcriptional regulator
MSLEHVLLGMLADQASGYDLRKAFDEGPRHFWSAELSQIYPALERMQARGWLRSRRRPSPRGPERRVYERTAKGAAALRAWLRAEPAVGHERLAYIGQLIFMGELRDPAATERFLELLRQRLQALAELLESAQAAMPRDVRRLTDAQVHEGLCLRIGIRSLRAKIEACEEGQSLLRARRGR